MRNPILHKGEKIIMRGRCSSLRLYIVERQFTVTGGGGFRWAALSGKTNIGTFACFPDAPTAFRAMELRVQEFHPKAALSIHIL